MRKLTEIEIKNEVKDMSDVDNIPDCILPGLDEFIDEWNRQVREINKKDRKNVLSWARGD